MTFLKLPKKLNKMDAEQQRVYFIELMNQHYRIADECKRLSQVVKKKAIIISDDRPDEIILKNG